MALANPVIVVPGITAVHLRDKYPLPPEAVWSVLGKDFERAALHPDDPRFEAVQPALVEADQLFGLAYGELIEELRAELPERDGQPVPVYPFAYDWRQPLAVIEAALAGFVDDVIVRTKLLRHYHKAGYGEAPKVNLLGHSMGGLVIAGYLQGAGRKAPVAKVATLATPYQGSFEAVIKIATGTANLGTSAPSARERHAARMTPALYHLLPSFKSGLEVEQGLPDTLFDSAVWQPSVVKTLKQYVQRHAVKTADAGGQAEALFKGFLKAARQHRQRVDSLTLADVGLQAKDWLCVVGAGATTRVALKVKKKGPDFALRSNDRDNQWSEPPPANRRRTGDGTVPFEGAVPKFLALENLVCVTPDDYGYWELQDAALTKAAGFHGVLPNMNMIHRLLVRHFTGRGDRHGNTWGRAAPGVAKWAPPIKNLRNKE